MKRHLALRKADWWVAMVFVGLGVAAFVFFNGLQTDPVDAEILPATAVDVGENLVEVRIKWTFPWTPQLTNVETVRVRAEALEVGTIHVWGDPDNGFTIEDPTYHLTPGDYVVGAVLGGLLGLVVVFSLNGYGYVRGTGEPGTMLAVDVREDRGFYWRS